MKKLEDLFETTLENADKGEQPTLVRYDFSDRLRPRIFIDADLGVLGYELKQIWLKFLELQEDYK